MLYIFFDWIWMFICAYLWGFASVKLINRLCGFKKPNLNFDFIIIFGIGVLTVYAEYFSLVYKVGAYANILLFIVDMLVLVKWHKEIISMLKEIITNKSNIWKYIIIILAITISSSHMFDTVTYDTGLYHAQAIQWIEKYGVVPGLGNLHHRFAYNSALMCLQALFSLKFLTGQSLHCVNGFMLIFYVSYAICSMKCIKYKKLFVSDFLRLSFFVCYQFDVSYSSSGSDLISLCLVIYLIIGFVECIEDKTENIGAYAYLSLLALIGVSFKLSIALIVLIAIYPAYILIKDRQVLLIAKLIVAGLVLIIPFIARNIVISGYLIYPYPELDVLNVDWKMNPYMCMYDRKEIQSWAQGVRDAKLSPGFNEWFAIWKGNLSEEMLMRCRIGVVSSVVIIICSVIDAIKYKDLKKPILAVTVISMLIYWFVGAPLIRYGIIYIIIPTYILLGGIVYALQNHYRILIPCCMLLLLVLIGHLARPLTSNLKDFRLNKETLLAKSDYENFDCNTFVLNGIDIYIPSDGDRIGYWVFPSTPYMGLLDEIELRGNGLKDGFRLKSEYRNVYMNSHGNECDKSVFE